MSIRFFPRYNLLDTKKLKNEHYNINTKITNYNCLDQQSRSLQEEKKKISGIFSLLKNFKMRKNYCTFFYNNNLKRLYVFIDIGKKF